ncbi:hypothetical protein A2997_01745 [Candidatus Nomurabacteria bacterium RIFCSPLOWO2_01_FULL_36_10b]|uniref:Uncharacterized protein n=1 Tax=Candidatus Nomurabacteria bacterium RIFCSPLOWO2_01_FULL_36_10b TaxID=1801766 RepID=A0A1F6WPK9_9BACT|nr:MAG: hypothetical protein A2997_01745 [Candidatus Nomurabacteria bacterium RIFCSPLOWO2_01_FULL_36_10b]
MTEEKILEVIELYRKFFTDNGIGKADYPSNKLLAERGLGPEHCHGMLHKMEKFIEEGRIEKTFRWLGFIQGVLWSNRLFTLDDLKNHSKP